MSFQENLRVWKRRCHMTTEDLSERSGVPRGTINKLLAGETRNPTAGTIRALAAALGCTVAELMIDNDGPSPRGMAAEATQVTVCRSEVPVLGVIAAGEPLFCEEDRELAIGANFPTCDFALRVDGDSMIGARINSGDLVFFRAQADVDDGEIAAVEVDGFATLKRVYHTQGGLTLLSENPKYAPMVFTLRERDRIRILGKAIGFQSLTIG